MNKTKVKQNLVCVAAAIWTIISWTVIIRSLAVFIWLMFCYSK